MTAPLDPVHITPREIYDQLVLLRDTVRDLAAQFGAHADDVRDHETRLRHLESRQWPLPTVSLLVALAAMVVGAATYLTR